MEKHGLFMMFDCQFMAMSVMAISRHFITSLACLFMAKKNGEHDDTLINRGISDQVGQWGIPQNNKL